MQTGQLNQRISFETYTSTKDELGQEVLSWREVKSVWCSVKTGTTREVMIGDRLVSQTNITFTIRYQDGLDPSMRVNYRGNLMPIIAINDLDGQREFLAVVCQKGQAT